MALTPVRPFFSATSRALARKSSGAGVGEETTLSQLLDFIGSAAQGDILYRSGSAWARLAVGGSGYFLKSNGSGNDLSWGPPAGTIAPWALAGAWTFSTNVANVDFTGLAGANDILVVTRNITKSVSGTTVVLVSDDNGATFYNGASDYALVSVAGVESLFTGLAVHGTNATAARSGSMLFHGANLSGTGAVKYMYAGCRADGAQEGYFVGATNPINAVRVVPSAGGNLTGGTITVFTK